MASDVQPDQYNAIASSYDSIERLPHSRLSQELVLHALGPDLTNHLILDLGGGSGLHARNALARGAKRVDNVDVSPDMLENSAKQEEAAGRKPGDKVKCFVGDVTRPLEEQIDLPDAGRYDVVLMLWTFDHATSNSELKAMWANVGSQCRSGGKVISIRSGNPWNRNPAAVKYGVELSDLKEIPGPGCRYTYTVAGAFSAEGTNMEANWDLEKARDLARRVGFEGLEVVPVGEMPAVKEDPEYWKEFVEQPGYTCVVGIKR